MAEPAGIRRLDGDAATLVFDLRRDVAELAYFGARLAPDEPLESLCNALRRGPHENAPDRPIPASVLPLGHTGYLGAPVVELLGSGQAITIVPQPVRAESSPCHPAREESETRELLLVMDDPASGIRLESRWRACDSGAIAVTQRITRVAGASALLLRAASVVLPLPRWVTQVAHYAGRWSAEMQVSRASLAQGPRIGGATRGGRSGFAGGQWLRFESATCSEETGSAIGVHLAWSGDHAWQVDTDADGQSTLWLGARLEAGEIALASGQSFEMPEVVIAPSTEGRAGLRRRWHRHVREAVLPAASRRTPRRIHLNTWEACGFDLTESRLMQLADQAAELGVERFVLDDGWFAGRRNDRSSLGDWAPAPEIFPQGLGPLIEHVQALGMDFGLWVEPEMVSPESQLYRAHPDWCLHVAGLPRATQRHQLVLDLSRPEVVDHLFAQLDGLLRQHPIAYLKWDHNRELFPTAGRGVAQTWGLYGLLDRLRAAHPTLEIESCASGGGRVDHAMMRRCARFWASDNNDALERLRINRAWTDVLPLCTLGNHVGPDPNPITGRRLPMDFRAKVAMFGHMGIEADPSQMGDDERRTLARHVALYRQWREVIHQGDLREIVSSDPGVGGWLAIGDARALALVTQREFARHFESAPVRLSGLDPAGRYRVTLPEPWPDMAARYLAAQEDWRSGLTMSGRALAESGIALPLRHPATAWLVALERI